MPWHVVDNHSDCPSNKPYAVVKNDSGEKVACHETREGAEGQVRALYASESSKSTELSAQVEVKAQDEGLFAAQIAAFSADREGDTILPGAFKNSLLRWRASGKRIPVVWHHQVSDVDAIIGYVDPANIEETATGLLVREGQINLETDRGKSVFELLKQGSMSWSFGYVVPPDGHKHTDDGSRSFSELDLLEITVTPIPANADTMTLATKSMLSDEVLSYKDCLKLHSQLEDRIEAAEKGISTAEWDGSRSRFSDEQWERSTILGDQVPIREPDGALNKFAVLDASRKIFDVDASKESRKEAESILLKAYEQIGETPPTLLDPSTPGVKGGDESSSRPPDPIKNEVARMRLEVASGRTLDKEE